MCGILKNPLGNIYWTIFSSYSPCVKVSLGKILNAELPKESVRQCEC